jgi:hypothetical protein
MIAKLVVGVVMLAGFSTSVGVDPGLGLPECPENQPTTFKCYNRGWQLPEEARVGHRIPGCVIDPVPGTRDPVSRCIDKGTEIWPPDATHPYCRDRIDPHMHFPCRGDEQFPH